MLEVVVAVQFADQTTLNVCDQRDLLVERDPSGSPPQCDSFVEVGVNDVWFEFPDLLANEGEKLDVSVIFRSFWPSAGVPVVLDISNAPGLDIVALSAEVVGTQYVVDVAVTQGIDNPFDTNVAATIGEEGRRRDMQYS